MLGKGRPKAAGEFPDVEFALRPGEDGAIRIALASDADEASRSALEDEIRASFAAVVAAMSPQRARAARRAVTHLCQRGRDFECRVRVQRDGHFSLLVLSGRACKDEHGMFLKCQARWAQTEPPVGLGAVLAAAVKVFPDMVWLKDTEGRYVLCNDMFERFNGLPRQSLIGNTAAGTNEGRTAKIHADTDRLAFQSHDVVTFEHEVGDEGAERRFFSIRKLAIRNEKGQPIGILGTARETTEWHRLAGDMMSREQAYRSLADNIPDCLIRISKDGQPEYMNRRMEQFLVDVDYPEPGKKGSPNAAAGAKLHALIDKTRSEAKPSTTEVEFIDRQGHKVVHDIRVLPEFDPDGRVRSTLLIGRDITARKQMERRLAENERELHALAYEDGLTGLHNRRFFQSALREVLATARQSKSLVALLLLDIDRFKSVNDTLGHAAGDDLIAEFAARIRQEVGEAGYVSRLGGDEFAIVLPAAHHRNAPLDLAERIHRSLDEPITLSSNRITITTSIGLAYGLGDAGDDTELFRFADMALYAAKSAGRARTAVYDCSMAIKAERRFELDGCIADGLRNNEFTAFFQTKTDLATGRIDGFEALCRWLRTDGETTSPAEFIPAAEESGQIIEIGRRVLVEACRFAATINAGRATALPVSVNVSGRQLLFGGFLGTLGACLEETGCRGNWIEIELTESLLLADDRTTSDILQAIAKLGVGLTIDDFGTGYSSLSYLARFPITTLKIDQSFVRDLRANSKNDYLCRAIISMAQGLGLKTVAEGIETKRIAKHLRKLGCDSGQGYFWSRPEPAEAVLQRLSERAPVRRKQSVGHSSRR